MLIDNEEQTRRSGQADVLIGHRLKFERRIYCQVHPNQHTSTAIPTAQPFFLLLTSQIPHLPAIPHNGRPIPPSPYASHLSPPIPTPAPKVQHEVNASNNIHPLPRSLSLAPFPA